MAEKWKSMRVGIATHALLTCEAKAHGVSRGQIVAAMLKIWRSRTAALQKNLIKGAK